MMTAQSIRATTAAGYAAYLESRTVAPEQGDYYLGADGAPAEAPGRWLTAPDALRRLGITSVDRIQPGDLRALMAGRRPGSPPDNPTWLRAAGADGQRAGGIDITFSAPKSVSVLWALAGEHGREHLEAAHATAVRVAVSYLRSTVPTTLKWDPEQRRNVPAFAHELHAAEFVHTTARGVAGQVPDPQLHSHVVITSLERRDGSVAAVRSRPVLRAARELGAYYRAALAHELRIQRYAIDSADPNERYFRVRGVPEEVERAFSKRTEEVRRAAQEFRATHGREPKRGELRALAVLSRDAKLPRTRDELDHAWKETAGEHGLDQLAAIRLRGSEPATEDRASWSDRVERLVTADGAMFDERRLRTVALEQAAATGLAAERALSLTTDLRLDGRVLTLADTRLTTGRMRALETELEERLTRLAARRDRAISRAAIWRGEHMTTERIGSLLTGEQYRAVDNICGPQRVAILVGPAGTGKGAVIDAAARAELDDDRRVFGVAVAGRTAQQLGEASPALAGRCRTIDSLAAAAERGEITLGPDTTVYVDEAGMGDTERLVSLVRAIDEHGGSIVLVGDHRQLPSVGAGGMFERLQRSVPTSELTEVQRTPDPAERDAWAALRHGDPALAMAHYRVAGRLRFADTRVEAVDQAARRYDELTREHRHGHVALMTDASNAEVDALNLRVQALRLERNELSTPIELPASGHRLYTGDRVCWTASMPVGGELRIENGVRGVVMYIDPEKPLALIDVDGGSRSVEVTGESLGLLRLGYAGHVYRQQGSTVDHAIVVTGGWQTSRESAYVEASRAREGADWFVAREELDGDIDAQRVDHLASLMRISRAQHASLAYELEPVAGTPDLGLGIEVAAGHEIEL
jgi:conjugative relaxase-like TrwC/TraI family protein